MPYPVQTSRAAITAAAYELIEQQGAAPLTLAQLAAALHIKAPSLYRHVANKAALIQLVNARTFELLFAAFDQALQGEAPPREKLRRVLHAHRAFAHAHPVTYVLAFTTAASADRPADEVLEQLVLPIQALMAALIGPERSLDALRGGLALAHGFAMLELNQQLRRGGDLNAAFARSVEAYLAGWQAASGS